MLEREAELAALSEVLSAAHAGEGRLLVFEGHAGIGKSALLANARDQAEWTGTAVLAGRGSQLERELSFGVVLQLFAPALARIPRSEREDLLAGAAGLARPLLESGAAPAAAAEEQEFALLHGLHWLCANFAERRPLLLVFDDAHFADRPSLRFLLYLAKRLDELPVAVLLALRPKEPGSPADLLLQLLGHPTARVMRLRPLSPASVEQLVRQRLPAAEEEFCQACAHASGGNPFLLQELLAAAESEGIRPVSTESHRLAQLAPETVLRATLARLVRLPPAAASLVRAVAVLGDDAELRHAAALAGLEPEEAARAADALAGIEILYPGEPLAFVHPLLRSAVEADLPVAERGVLHLRAARLLAADASPERVASHLLRAPASGDSWVVDALEEAARHALANANHPTATLYLRRALAEPPTPQQKAAVLLDLGEAEALAGEPTALERLNDALTLMSDPRERARTMLRLGWTLHKSGRIADAATAYERGVSELGGVDADLEAELELNYLQAAWLDSDRAVDAHARIAKVIAQQPDVDRPTGRALLAEVAMMRVVKGQPRDDAVPILKRVLAGGKLLRDEGPESLTLWHVVGGLSWSDELEIAESTCDAALAEAARLGAFLATAHALYGRSWPRYWRGRISDAVADAQGAVDAWRGGWSMYLPAAMYWLGAALIERDDLEAAANAIDLPDAEGRWSETGMYVLWLCARGRLSLACGDPRGALVALRHAGNLAAGFGGENPGVVPWRGDAALAAAQLGERDEARALAADDVRAARRFGAPRPIGMALRAAGLVEGRERGAELLREAVSVLETSPAKLELARALIDLGATLRRAGKRMEAREPLRRGLAMVERFGAHRLERQGRAELEASGARLRRPALSGVAALTPSERRVAEMAADGMSNREIAQALFVTVKAVKFHLGNAYGKLDVSGRNDLPAALREPTVSLQRT